MPSRRQVLTAAAAAGGLVLGGCSDSAGTTTVRQTPSTTPTPTGVGTATPEGTATPDSGNDTVESTDPPYATPSAYETSELSLSATDDCSLGATLTIPDAEGPVPGAVIVHGSGPLDRDGTVGPVKPYRDIARGLATFGVAVLRYDKRTFACSDSINPASLTLDDVATDDALTALQRLREHDRVAADETFVVGHSLGGVVGPRIASRDGQVAGIAMLAANARPLPTVIVEQTRYAVERDGEITDAEQRQLEQTRALAERLRTVDIEPGQIVAGGSRPFWQDLADYDQVAAAQALSVPVFVGQGTRDRQVSPEDDFGRWESAIGDRESVTTRLYDGLNHYFVDGAGLLEAGGQPESGVVDRQVVTDLASWVEGTTDGNA